MWKPWVQVPPLSKLKLTSPRKCLTCQARHIGTGVLSIFPWSWATAANALRFFGSEQESMKGSMNLQLRYQSTGLGKESLGVWSQLQGQFMYLKLNSNQIKCKKKSPLNREGSFPTFQQCCSHLVTGLRSHFLFWFLYSGTVSRGGVEKTPTKGYHTAWWLGHSLEGWEMWLWTPTNWTPRAPIDVHQGCSDTL